MKESKRCERCGHDLTPVRKPVRRLRWTRYWGEGFKSLFTGPLLHCSRCGALYANSGDLLAVGALETDAERRLNVFRRDMAVLRDSFAGVVVAAGAVAAWIFMGAAGGGDIGAAQGVLAASIGGAAIVPYVFFWRKARIAKKELKQLSQARRDSARLEG